MCAHTCNVMKTMQKPSTVNEQKKNKRIKQQQKL